MALQISVSEVGEYIRHQSCHRRFKLSFNGRAESRKLPFVDRLFNTIDPVLQESGQKRENEWEKILEKQGFNKLNLPDAEGNQIGIFFEHAIGIHGTSVKLFAREVEIKGVIKDFEIHGRIDFLIFEIYNSNLRIRIVECKASRRDRTYHRIQVCLYKLLVLDFLKSANLTANGILLGESSIECVVARIDEDTNKSQDIFKLEPLLLDREEDDLMQLLGSTGSFKRIIESTLESLSFQLNLKCDDCVFNVHCLSESGRLRKLELLSIDSSAVSILHKEAINTIDLLADIDLSSIQANNIRNHPSFTYNLDLLKKKSQARRKTLLKGEEHPDEYAVTSYGFNFSSQLPAYEIGEHRLIRIYLAVDYDYVENRVVGLSAHITKSLNKLRTEFNRIEIFEVDKDKNEFPVTGQYVIEKVSALWNGDYLVDNGTERQLISTFFRKLIDNIAVVAQKSDAPIHFYVWSKDEIQFLVDACSRVDTNLLSSLNQLLGCREGLEQLIYSTLKDEVDKRFGLGWTGRGLSVVTSLSWFGERFHWYRHVSGAAVFLDRAFTQDIFDFKTDLDLDPNLQWAKPSEKNKTSHKFEIRSRFSDKLTVPYWYAYWGELPELDTPGLDPKVKNAIQRYNEAMKPGYLESFLKERVHALRWIEERNIYKNNELAKPILNISSLANYHLGVHHTRRSALDFLRLDFNVKLTEWISSHILPPINRILDVGTIPVKNVKQTTSGLRCEINLLGTGLTIEQLKNNCSFSVRSFVRISPCNEDLQKGQTVRQLLNGGMTAVITLLDWEAGLIDLTVINSGNSSKYLLKSLLPSIHLGDDIFDFATIDESVSDFVANKVEKKLLTLGGDHINTWFDPERPSLPPAPLIDVSVINNFDKLLSDFEIRNGDKLKDDQRQSIIEGLLCRVHLLLGPPGTGKTMTTSISVLSQILMTGKVGDVVVIAANTHLAFSTLLNRISSVIDKFNAHARQKGHNLPAIRIAAVDPNEDDALNSTIEVVNTSSAVSRLKQLKQSFVTIVGGTTGAILKLAEKHVTNPFKTSFLVVDEASMMVLPHFLSLATIVNQDGKIMLAGDNRQLSPITAHDWEREDRPPVIKYQPYLSAYEAVSNLRKAEGITNREITLSSLKYTFRLPADIRDLIGRLYIEDNVDLIGKDFRDPLEFTASENLFEQIWQVSAGIFLVIHNERDSRKSNPIEASVLKRIIEAAPELGSNSVAVITPHRAQRTLLINELKDYREAIAIIDTVERLQGGERPNVIVSATASDPSSIGINAEFILNLNRANVAFSRAQERLVVICSQELINYIPAEIEYYDSSLLWKTLRRLCSKNIGTLEINNHNVQLFTIDRALLD